jgi:hypothetical protein
MTKEAKSDRNLVLYLHYAQALISGVFQSDEHKKILVEQKQLYENRYLQSTAYDHTVMINAGFTIGDDFFAIN